MKTTGKIIIIISMILFTGMNPLRADGPAAPPPPGHNSGGNQGSGGKAPLDGGSLFLLILGSAYGGYKRQLCNKK